MWRSLLITFFNQHILKKNIERGKRKIKSTHFIYCKKRKNPMIFASKIVKYVYLLLTVKGTCHKIYESREMK